MRSSLVAAALAAPLALAVPVKRQTTNIDTTVLQFALTLEHLENVFYAGALQNFTQADFLAAGFGADYYENLKFVASDEASHVAFLQAALIAAGQTPTAQCTYNFPYFDVTSFVTLSSLLEGLGTSAYLGAAPLITSKNYLTAAGSILVTESLHTSLQRLAINEIAAATPYGTPLDPTSVYTLAASLIVSCPPSNPNLGFTPYPSLSVDTYSGTCEQGNCSPMVFDKRDSTGWGPATPTESEQPEYYTSTASATSSTWTAEGTYAPESEHGYPSGSEPSSASAVQSGWSSAEYPEATSSPSSCQSGWANQPQASTPPSTTRNQPALKDGQSVSLTAQNNVPAGSYLTFVYGLTVTSVPANVNGKTVQANIPNGVAGQTYVFVTSAAAQNNQLDASTVLFGPAILEVAPALL